MNQSIKVEPFSRAALALNLLSYQDSRDSRFSKNSNDDIKLFFETTLQINMHGWAFFDEHSSFWGKGIHGSGRSMHDERR